MKDDGLIAQLLVADNGFDLVCQPLFGRTGWRCAACKRGILNSWDKKCKVCKRPVILRRSSNRRARVP